MTNNRVKKALERKVQTRINKMRELAEEICVIVQEAEESGIENYDIQTAADELMGDVQNRENQLLELIQGAEMEDNE